MKRYEHGGQIYDAATNLTASLTSLTDSTSKTLQLTYGGKKS